MKEKQISDSWINAIFLILSGAAQDAYTYFFRGKVFANAQTGNIVLMSSYIVKLDFLGALKYIIPLMFFAFGVFIAEVIHKKYVNLKQIHWRQIVIIFEIVLLFIVGFIPEKYNVLANAIVSFSCAMQVQAFRKVKGCAYASTMCIGNLRSAMDRLCNYVFTKDKEILRSFIQYIKVIFVFAIGAAIGYKFTNIIGIKAIWISPVLLIISFLLMFIKETSQKNCLKQAKEENKNIN